MDLAETCYECASFGNTFKCSGESSCVGYCFRVDDPGFVYAVKKSRSFCLFGNADAKLSDEEIKARDERERSHAMSFQEYLEKAKEVTSSWPSWKRRILSS